MKRKILLTPGPATTSLSVKQAQIIPDICPRESDFSKILSTIEYKLLNLVNGKYKDFSTILLTGSGTSIMDSVISSIINKGQLLVIENGAYGYRFFEIGKAYNIPSIRFFAKWGERIPLNRLEYCLKQNSDIEAVCVIHHETTTGILNDIESIGKIVKKYNKTYIIDCISSIGGKYIDINKVKADYLIGTANKCIQGLPGLSFVICKTSHLEKTKNYPIRNYYLNLYKNYLYYKFYKQTKFTPCVMTIYAFLQALLELEVETLNCRITRYENLWYDVQKEMKNMNFKKLLNDKDESKLLTTYYEPKEFDFLKIHDELYNKGFTIYPGKLFNNKTFRIGNIGNINKNDINKFFKTFRGIYEKR